NYMPQSVSYDITIDNSCNSFVRGNNSDLSWDQIDSHESNRLVIYGHSDKSEEIISTLGTKFSLGADATLCPGGTILLQTESVNYERIEWSTGSNESEITIDKPGTFWAKAYSDCGITVDSINVFLSQEP